MTQDSRYICVEAMKKDCLKSIADSGIHSPANYLPGEYINKKG